MEINKRRHFAHAFFKKIIIIISVVLLAFTTVFISTNQQAYAIGGKVASSAAKKIGKELVTDSAVSLAEEMIFHYQMEELLEAKYKTKSGYTAICLDEVKSDKCKKPAQIKKDLDDNDKKKLGDKVEEVLDRKSGTTGWKKWLDWIVPIWIIGTTIQWITTLLDPDVENLFDQVAKESLIETDLMTTIEPQTKLEIGENGNGFPINPTTTQATSNNIVENIIDNRHISQEYVFGLDSSTRNTIQLNSNFYITSGYFVVDVVPKNNDSSLSVDSIYLVNDNTSFEFLINNTDTGAKVVRPYGNTIYGVNQYITKTYLNGVQISSSNGSRVGGTFRSRDVKQVIVSPYQMLPGSSVLPYRDNTLTKTNLNNVYATQYIKIELLNGDIVENIYTAGYTSAPSTISYSNMQLAVRTNALTLNQIGVRFSYFGNSNFNFNETFVPTFDEVAPMIQTNALEGIKDSDGKVTVIPPTTIPIETPDGISVKPDDKSSTGWVKTKDKTEIAVDEDELIVKDPIKTPSGIQVPDGQIIPKPEPKPNPEPNPNPDPGGTPTETPTETEINTKPNMPWQVLIALLDMLRSILMFMARMFTFVLTLPLITPIPIENATFQWFKNANLLGIDVYNLVSTLATIGLSLAIYRIVRRLF